MGMFTSTQKNISGNEYEKRIKKFLIKDGNTHIIMVNSFSKFIDQNFGLEDKYTTQIDSILSDMQKDGYQIIDIKFDSLQNQGLLKDMEGFHTLITYKWS